MVTWHETKDEYPERSGYYEVEDRKGRVFRTWYESTIRGFSMVHDGVGYKIVRWRETE